MQGSAGIGISLNPRVALGMGDAHNWLFETRTIERSIRRDPVNGVTFVNSTTRCDLRVGRRLFGVSYCTSPSTTINRNVEIGATGDAADVHSSLRIPISVGGRN